MKLKTGIIGCGKVGDFHAKAYAQLENSEFTAVCDANLERAKAFAARYNVHAYSDIAEMIQKEHLNVVSVCTPHPIHCDPAVTAAENGCNVLIEKPLASSLADCDRIIEAGDKNHVTIGTMVQRRFYRPCMRIHEAIEAGKILAEAGINPDTRVKDLTDADEAKLREAIDHSYIVEGDLRRQTALDIKRLSEIGCYRGTRHRRGLPVRGQRSKTNARTRKGPKKTIANKKK